MMEDMEMDLEAPAEEGGAPDLTKIADMVRMLSDQLEQLKSMLPSDAGEETAELVDEGNAEGAEDAEAEGPGPVGSGEDDEGDDQDPKEVAKMRAAALLSRSIK